MKKDSLNKLASYLAHATNEKNIDAILSEGKLKTLDLLSESDKELSIEAHKGLRFRSDVSVKDSIESLRKNKTTNKIFFTKDGYESSYGDYVILKKYNRYKNHDKFTFIPNEVVVGRPVSLKKDSMVFVPKDKVESLREKHPDYFIRSNESLPIKPFKTGDKLKKLIIHFTEKKASFDFLGDVFLQGSEAIGIDLKENSDRDYLVKAKNYEDAIDKSIKLLKKYPDFKSSPYNRKENKKMVFKGNRDGKEVDVVFDWTGSFDVRKKAFEAAKSSLTEEEKIKIKSRKRKLKNSFFFPETRYKNYKTRINKDLGVYI